MKHGKMIRSLLFAAAGAALSLTGCRAPNYTGRKAKEIAAKYRTEAELWFETNEPGAVIQTCEAYNAGVDLLAAVRGHYKKDGKSWYYVYDYYNHDMYTSEGYDACCDMIAAETMKGLGIDPATADSFFTGFSFSTKNENDNFKSVPIAPEDSEYHSTLLEKMLPADIDPETYANAVLDGEVVFSYSIYSYDGIIPEYDASRFELYPNLGAVNYYADIDVTEGFDGIFKERQSSSSLTKYRAHFTEIGDGFYGGYVIQEGRGEYEDRLEVESGKGEFTLRIPEQAEPVLFTGKDRKFSSIFKNGEGKEIEVKSGEMKNYKEACPGRDDFLIFENSYLVRNSVNECYRRMRIVSVEGEYRFVY